MKKWKLILVLSAIAFGAAPVLDALLWTDAAASAPDHDPPEVQVQPSATPDAGAPWTVGARVIDPSGIGSVVLWVRGEKEKKFKSVKMVPVGDDRVQVELAPWPEQGSSVAYYIEARDGKGNGPSYAGGPRTPYVVRFNGAIPAPVEARTNWVLWGATSGALILLIGGYFLYRRAAREKLSAELIAELNRMAGDEFESAPHVVERMPKSAQRKPKVQVPQNPVEQAFWIGMLTPLAETDGRDREHGLQRLAVRAHHHPTLGKRFFDIATLTRHLAWVERGEIQVTAEMLAPEAPRFHKLDD